MKGFLSLVEAVLVLAFMVVDQVQAQPKGVCLQVSGERVEVHNLGSTWEFEQYWRGYQTRPNSWGLPDHRRSLGKASPLSPYRGFHFRHRPITRPTPYYQYQEHDASPTANLSATLRAMVRTVKGGASGPKPSAGMAYPVPVPRLLAHNPWKKKDSTGIPGHWERHPPPELSCASA